MVCTQMKTFLNLISYDLPAMLKEYWGACSYSHDIYVCGAQKLAKTSDYQKIKIKKLPGQFSTKFLNVFNSRVAEQIEKRKGSKITLTLLPLMFLAQ